MRAVFWETACGNELFPGQCLEGAGWGHPQKSQGSELSAGVGGQNSTTGVYSMTLLQAPEETNLFIPVKIRIFLYSLPLT